MAAPKTTIDRLAVVVGTAGGAGFLPKAPGTAGALAGVFLYLLMETLQIGSYLLHVIILVFIAGVFAARQVETFWGHDSQRIVIDEVVGQWVAFLPIAGRRPVSSFLVVMGFVLFRLFDIRKPFPLGRLEKLPGGVGVMADDVGAGVYALFVLILLEHLFGA